MNQSQANLSPTTRSLVIAEIAEAARITAPLWPLGTAVAVNPLWDLRHLGFDGAITRAREVLGIDGYPSASLLESVIERGLLTDADLVAAAEERAQRLVTRRQDEPTMRCRSVVERRDPRAGGALLEALDAEVARWATWYVGEPLVGSQPDSFYRYWREHAPRDRGVRRLLGKAGARAIALLPEDPLAAVTHALEGLDLEGPARRQELMIQLGRLLGWASHAKWRSQWFHGNTHVPPLGITNFLAVRMAYLVVLEGAHATVADGRGHHTPEDDVPGLWGDDYAMIDQRELPPLVKDAQLDDAPRVQRQVALRAMELHYQHQLASALGANHHATASHDESTPPRYQAVFCIDVRSEGLRRHLERDASIETFGFAGFFGMPLHLVPLGATEGQDLLPVLLRPSVELAEQALAGGDRRLDRHQGLDEFARTFDHARESPVAPFIMAEAGGLISGVLAGLRTSFPDRFNQLTGSLRGAVEGDAPIEGLVQLDERPALVGELARAAEAGLRAMGLVDGFAPLVLLCGHGSTTSNNAFAASLDCGACGGSRGGGSARAAAAVFNWPPVRDALRSFGIDIPETTRFVAGEHDTATDEVTIFHRDELAHDQSEALGALEAALAEAGARLRAERLPLLPPSGSRGEREARRRSADWAQVQPEWGLANNAAFIIGPRRLTKGIDLERRVFLHSYRSEIDPDGRLLEAILGGPMVVAHWISSQYYFSTVDPARLSAGDKTLHNPVAHIGVVTGESGDLRVGLPLQSLFDGDQAMHQPMRLLVVIAAEVATVLSVLGRSELVRELIEGEWVHLLVTPSMGEEWMTYLPGVGFVPWDARTAPHETKGIDGV
jgi:uncharacterized protein YbcC (UPF0753/DUF2309 family)